MERKPSIAAILLLISLLLFQIIAPDLDAQTSPLPTPEELDQLLAPIALYPDSLLAQITTASTNPQEILDVDNWLAQNPNLTGTALTDAAQAQGFDPAFIALTSFPQILEMMAEHIDDYAAIGEAFSADQGAVSASVQRLRAQAYASGALRSTPQQQVVVQQVSGQPIYVIQPASPQVVYVPQYDPTLVYARGGTVAAVSLTFGVGIGIGALLISNRPWGWGGWGWNWGGRRVYYNHGPWNGWANGYRPPRPWYRPRPIIYGNRPGYGGNWKYRPRNYQPPRPINRPRYTPPGTRPTPGRSGNSPSRRNPSRPTTTPGRQPGRPNTNRPVPSNPNRPRPARPTPNQKTSPDGKVGGNKKGNNRPARPSKPADQNGHKDSGQGSGGRPQ